MTTPTTPPAPPDVRACLQSLPLIAILRGLRPEASVDVGRALVDAGFRIIEVPLNSPQPFASIERLAQAVPGTVLVGAGTVLDPADVDRVRDAGGRLIVMPHADRAASAPARRGGPPPPPGGGAPARA